MFKLILSWITGGGLGGIASELRQAHKDKLSADNDGDRIAADVTIAQLTARQGALINGRGAWVSKLVQAMYAAPFLVYNGKVIVWDKVLGLGVTDPLGQYEQNLGLMIIGFYFLTIGGGHLASKVRR